MPEFTSWWDFIRFSEFVQNSYRYVHTKGPWGFLDALIATSSSHHRVFGANEILWRAQRGHASQLRDVEEFLVEEAIPHPPERMKPHANLPFEGRVNPKGIPCLYLATDKNTAMAEARPWVGCHISLGEFRLGRDMTVIDFSMGEVASLGYYPEEPSPEQRAKIIWAQIDQVFSIPLPNDVPIAEYVPTQIIAEAFRQEGLDGVAYRSSLGQGINVALFDLQAADLLTCSLYVVESNSLVFKPVGATSNVGVPGEA